MSEISGIRLINSVNEDAFEDKIQKVVASMQGGGLDVEIQYQCTAVGSGHSQRFTALVIGRKRDIGVKIGPLTVKPANI